MDKLTSIRIKYNDGTYLDQIPIGVLVQNVGYDSSHNLLQVLGTIDVDSDGTIQAQINKLFNEKVNSSDLDDYVNNQISTNVTQWLAANVTPTGSAVMVDQSLSISGAAADAKVVGDELTDLKNDLDDVINGTNRSFSVTTNKINSFKYVFLNGIQYTVTNNTGGTINFKLVQKDGTEKIINANFLNGNSINFVPDRNDFVMFTSWVPSGATGTIDLLCDYSILAITKETSGIPEELKNVKNDFDSLDYHVRYETEEIIAEKSVSTTSGTTTGKPESEFNVSIANGTSFRFRVSGASFINKFALYYNEGGESKRFGINLLPNTNYDYTAPKAITSLYIYVGATDVIGTGTLKLTVSNVVQNNDSVDKKIADLKSDLSEIDEEVTSVINLESYSANVQATSGTPINFTNHIFDVAIPQGKYYSFEIEYSGTSEYQLYADEVIVFGQLYANNKNIFYANTAITSLSIYTKPNVTETIYCTLDIFDYVEKSGINYLKNQVGAMVDKSIAIPFILLKGFYNPNGTINNSVNNDVHTQPINVTGGDKLYINVALGDQTKSIYVAYFAWDSSGNILGRTVINSTNTGSYSGVLTVPSNVSKLSIMYRTYGNASLKLQKEWSQFDSYVMDAVSINQPSNTVRTIAHRGDDIYAPQCTAPAYIAARKHGLSIAENDLWASEDGEFIMWHDTTLYRLGNLVDINGYLMYTDGSDYYWVHPTTNNVYTYDYVNDEYVASDVSLSGLTRCAGRNYSVNSSSGATGLNLNVLKRIDFGVYKGSKFAGTQILTFEEWVMLCKQLGMEIYVDRKMSYTNDILAQLANIVKKCGMGDYTSWLGIYSVPQINFLRSIIPNARVGILRHPSESDVEAYAVVNTGRGFFFNGDAKNGMTPEVIQIGLNAGFEVEVWYVDYGNATSEEVFTVLRNAVSCGVTGVSTDHYRFDEAFEYLMNQY